MFIKTIQIIVLVSWFAVVTGKILSSKTKQETII